MENRKNRRQFIKTSALGATAAYLGTVSVGSSQTSGEKSRIVRVHDSRMLDSSEKINAETVKPVINDVLTELTGTGSVKDAWMKIFPDLRSSDIIGFKVNCINRYLSSHPEVVLPLTESLVDSLGINPNNIIIWDRTDRELVRYGFVLNKGGDGIRVMGTSEDVGYDENRLIKVNEGVTVRPSKILSQMCTYIVNVPVLKDHERSGVTLSMKNHFGSIDSPRTCHPTNCNPYIPNINRDPLVAEKTKLIFCDAIQGIYDGGPGGTPQWVQNELIAGFDTVAFDYTGMNIIEKKRKENGFPSIASMAEHIQTAADMGLGTNNIENIDVRTVSRG
ncbi:MAG: DUF362 domain-containing protein [Acidobacteriota bacterium]